MVCDSVSEVLQSTAEPTFTTSKFSNPFISGGEAD